jgi:STE24 endopeptidase
MTPSTLLLVLVGIICFDYVLDRAFDLLNLSRMRPELPPELKAFYDEEKYSRSQKYLREKSRFALLVSTFSFVATLTILLTGMLGTLDTWLRGYTTHPYLLPMLFFAVLAVASDVVGTPFALYNIFVIEEKYGFNKTTFKTWMLDKLKGAVLGAILGGFVLMALIWLLEQLQEGFWIWFWVGMTVFSLGLQYMYTTLLLPIFNKLKPLEDGDLRSAIESYSARVGFPLGNIMVMDGSKRSTKANAFFAGFGSKKRIILYDTLVAQMSQSEILAVLAHEVGHYKRRHIILSMVLGIANIGVLLFVFSRLVFEPSLSEALGATSPGVHLNLLSFFLLYSPISQLTGLGMNLLSRKNEYEADAYARATSDGKALQSALIKLHVETLSNLRPHPAYVFWHYSHPTLLQRIGALEGGRTNA